ncbi:MAG: 50S ribosomal protein L29 [Candidatus Altimarinota bacterium]
MLTKEEIKKTSEAELYKEISKTQNELLVERMKLNNQTSKETHAIKAKRRYVAQLKTQLTQAQAK